MSSGTRNRASRKPIVVIAGEDGSDRQSLRILLEEFCPQFRGRIVEIKDSVRLRLATGQNLVARVETLAAKARARAVREHGELACVFVHEDSDIPEGADCRASRERVQKALEAALGTAHYVLAAAELEAWLLLFPSALESFARSWKVPARRRGRDSGMEPDPKVILRKEVCIGRPYRESDAPAIFEKAVALGCLEVPAGTNGSWHRFRADARVCCSEHLRRA